MGESSVIRKFRRLLVECDEDHVYHGTVLEFIKEDDVPEERYEKGMVVSGQTGTRMIDFSKGDKEYIKNASPFRIGDEVLVLGKKNHSQPSKTLPLIILFPEEESVVLAKENLGIKFHGWVDYAHVLFYILVTIFGLLFWFRDLIYPMLTGALFIYRPLVYWSPLLVFLTFLGYVALNTYIRQKYREREILCDPETWKIISDAISKQFSFSIT